jgi:hypothetical protein
MKKSIKSILTALLIVSVIPTQMYAGVPTKANPITKELSEAEVVVLTHRLNEIKEMDISNMSRPEKKALRKEVKGIQKVMSNGNGGIYISLGALLIIILLLIIIF